jgi:hypothetical protein
MGPVLADVLGGDAVFSNIRVRGIGFRFQYPTLDEGLEQILLMLREFEGLSYRELSQAMGMPIGTVMSTLSRARRVFREALKSQTRCGTPGQAVRERDRRAVPV